MFYNKNPNDQMLGIVLLMMFCDFYHGIHHHFSPPFGKYVLDFFQQSLSKSRPALWKKNCVWIPQEVGKLLVLTSRTRVSPNQEDCSLFTRMTICFTSFRQPGDLEHSQTFKPSIPTFASWDKELHIPTCIYITMIFPQNHGKKRFWPPKNQGYLP